MQRGATAMAVPPPNLHNPPMSHCRAGALVLVLLSAACRKEGSGPPVEGVRPAEESRPHLIMSISVAPLDRTTAHVDALARTLGLPFAGKDLLTMLSANHGLTADAMAQIDTSQPIGVAYVTPQSKEHPPIGALVATARSKQALDQLVSSLGTIAESQKGARRVQRADGSILWVATSGTSLFAATSLDGLTYAGALAKEAQRAPAEEVVVTMFPEALARWRGTDVRTALAEVRKEAFDDQIAAAERRGNPVPGPAERVIYEALLASFMDPLAETTSGALSLTLDPERGIRFGLKLAPRAGSAFAKRVASPTPYVVDPALFAAGQDPIAVLWAVGPSPFWLETYDAVLAAEVKAGLKGADEVSRHYRTLRPFLSGASSGELRARRDAITTDVVVPLKVGGSPAALDALAALTTSPGFAALLGEVYGHQAPQVQAKRERETLRTELAFPVRDRPGDVGTAVRAIFGSATLSLLATVANGRLVAATEPAAAERLAALRDGPPRAPPPEIAAALAETKGHDGLVYLDLWATIRPVALATAPSKAGFLGMTSMMPGFSQLKLPVVMSHRGGDALTAELRVPLATLNNAATVLRPLVGAGPLSP
jgi:hypothetical protein